MSGACEQYAIDLSAYFDEELEPAEAAAVKAHLEGCARCRVELERMRGLRQALNRTGAAALPERRLLQDLMRALGQPESRQGAGRNGEEQGRGVTRGR
jgi:anti-sigma factor RsiW